MAETLKTDTTTKDYISDADVFADIFNYYIYGGRQVILPEQLKECDTTKIALPYGADGQRVPVQKFRDVQKLYTGKTGMELELIIYGAENQTEIHYAMPVKNNLYDALDYTAQVEQIAKLHKRKREQEKEKKPSHGEFLSGFWKEDRLIPSVTVTIYFGSDEWDGPLSLFDMMTVTDSDVLKCIDNYHVHLIAPALMADEEIMKFQSSFREVMLFIKYSKDKGKLNEILKSNEKRFRQLERRAVDVIEVITNSGIKYGENEEEVDVCQAIQEMRRESEQEGRRLGEQEGRLKASKEVAKNLYIMDVAIEKIASAVGYTVEEVEQWLGL